MSSDSSSFEFTCIFDRGRGKLIAGSSGKEIFGKSENSGIERAGGEEAILPIFIFRFRKCGIERGSIARKARIKMFFGVKFLLAKMANSSHLLMNEEVAFLAFEIMLLFKGVKSGKNGSSSGFLSNFFESELQGFFNLDFRCYYPYFFRS